MGCASSKISKADAEVFDIILENYDEVLKKLADAQLEGSNGLSRNTLTMLQRLAENPHEIEEFASRRIGKTRVIPPPHKIKRDAERVQELIVIFLASRLSSKSEKIKDDRLSGGPRGLT